MPLSYASFPGDGTNRIFSIPFKYLQRSHLKVTVDGVEVPFEFLSDSAVQLDNAPASNTDVRLRRRTLITKQAVTFANASTLKEEQLNTADLQKLYAIQEANDDSADGFAAGDAAVQELRDYVDEGLASTADEANEAAARALQAQQYLASYIEQILLSTQFPLDLGLVIDPVITSQFDLGNV